MLSSQNWTESFDIRVAPWQYMRYALDESGNSCFFFSFMYDDNFFSFAILIAFFFFINPFYLVYHNRSFVYQYIYIQFTHANSCAPSSICCSADHIHQHTYLHIILMAIVVAALHMRKVNILTCAHSQTDEWRNWYHSGYIIHERLGSCI